MTLSYLEDMAGRTWDHTEAEGCERLGGVRKEKECGCMLLGVHVCGSFLNSLGVGELVQRVWEGGMPCIWSSQFQSLTPHISPCVWNP